MNGQVICETCGISVDIGNYEKHIKYGHNLENLTFQPDENKDLKCYICGKSFTSSYNLKYHIAHHINARSFVCDECPKAFNTASDLSQHKRVHSNIVRVPRKAKKLKPQTCPVCSKTVVRLTMHIQVVHMNQRNYNCEFCDKKFGKKGGLDRHILVVHKNIRNFKCDQCDRTFGERSLLVRHQTVHSGVKTSIYCTVCKKYVDNIKNHYETVHADLPLKCVHCHRRFARQRDHDIHVSSKHTKLRKWLCDLCGRKFLEKYQLKKHFQSHINSNGIKKDDIPHYQDIYKKDTRSASNKPSKKKGSRKYICNLCGKKLVTMKLLKSHLDRHQSRKEKYCNICKIYSDNIKEHYETEHNDLEFTCYICYKKFARYKQLKNHNNSNHTAHSCDICGKIFYNLIGIKLHMDMDHLKRVKEEKKSENDDDDYNVPDDQGNDNLYESDSDSKMDIKPNVIENIIVDTIDIKKEPEDFYDETFYETEVPIKKEDISNSENGCIFDIEIADNIKEEEISIEPDQIEDTNDVEDEDDVVFKCSVCEALYRTKDSFRLHYMSTHVKEKRYSFACTPCNKTYKSKELIYKHLNRVHRKLKNDPIKAQPEPNTNVDNVDDDDDGQEVKCNACDTFYITRDEFRLHYLSEHTKENENSFSCIPCDKSYKSKELILIHIRRSHRRLKNEPPKVQPDPTEETSRMCSICGKTYKTEKSLSIHIKTLHREKSVLCPICGKKFSLITQMKKHRERNHEQKKKHKCDICSLKFVTKFEVKLHQKHNHNLDRKDACKEFMCYCGVSFPMKCVLSRHKRIVHGDKDPDIIRECEICKEVLETLHLKKKHMAQVHLNGKKLKRDCKFCKAEFELFDDFKAHIESHAELFICITCGEYYFDAESLKSHQSVHRKVDFNLRKFICDHCGHRVFTKIQLGLHMLKHIKECKMHYCDICGKGFKFQSSLYTHRKYHLEGELSCTQCDRKFVRNHDLIIHLRKHNNERPFRCPVCDRGFSIKLLYQNHLQSHPETRVIVKCKRCDYSTYDKKEMNSHEDQFHPDLRPFRCHICDMSFRHDHNLRKHNSHKHV